MFRKISASLLALLGFGIAGAQAQNAPTFVQQSGSHLDAAILSQASTAAVNTALTVTLPAVSGQYHYITALTLGLCQDTTASTTLQIAVTTTNLNGWLTQIGQPSSAGRCDYFPYTYPNGLKSSAPGTATVITVAQPGAHGAPIVNVNYFVAP